MQIAIGEADELESLRLVSSSTSTGFCYLTLKQSARLSEIEAKRLINIIHLSGFCTRFRSTKGSSRQLMNCFPAGQSRNGLI